MNPLLLNAMLLLAITCGCSSDASTQSVADGKAPKLAITEPAANSKVKVDKNDKAKKLKVTGKVDRQSDEWVPALILVKICTDKQAKNVISSFAEKPQTEADATLTFAYEMDRPTKKGKYYVIAVAISKEHAVNGPGTTKGKTEVLKSEPTSVEFEVTDR